MSNQSEKSEAVAEKIGGKIKKVVGQIVGDHQIEAEGAAKELKGNAREQAAKGAERAKGVVEELKGAVKNRVGHIIDNEQMAAEGKVTELKGEARQKANK